VVTPITGDEFLVFPPTATVQPGQTQVVRIRWVGDPILKESRAYMFNTAELPVNQLKGSGVQVVYAIESLVTVTSPSLKPNIAASAGMIETETQPANSDHPARTVPGMGVTISNSGNGLDFLTNYKFTLKSGAWSMTIDPHDVAQYVGLGLVLPNSKRHFFLVLPNLPAAGPVEFSLEREPGR
jgi:P pilus assembly chaperone PapD